MQAGQADPPRRSGARGRRTQTPPRNVTIAAGRPASGRARCRHVVYRQRAGDAAAGKMLHEAEEERQVGGRHALLVERQYVLALLGDEEIIGVLDPLGDALQETTRRGRSLS